MNIEAAFLLVFLPLSAALLAQDTHVLFSPIEQQQLGDKRVVDEHNIRQKEEAVSAGECRPAELDPDGNWGRVTDGFQLSIRARTNVFVKGRVMSVKLILRNTTTSSLYAPPSPPLASVFIVDADNREKRTRQEWPSGGPMYVEIPGRRQVTDTVDLSEDLSSMKPGTYQVYAQCRVFGVRVKPIKLADVRSAMLTVKVVEREK